MDMRLTLVTGATVIVLVAVILPQTPAAIVLVTIYVPGVLAAKLTWPVALSKKTRPAVEENVPAAPPPVKFGEGLAALVQ